MNDLLVFYIINHTWEDLTLRMRGTVPNARAGHGFATQSGNLYVHGGANADTNGTDRTQHISSSIRFAIVFELESE